MGAVPIFYNPISVFLFGLFLTSVIIGVTVCILVLLFGYKAEVAAWSMVNLLVLICGVYYPVSILPFPFREIARAIPLTYFLEYLRSFYGFEAGNSHLLGWGFGLIGVYLAAEGLFLKAALHRARKNGTFIKLSE